MLDIVSLRPHHLVCLQSFKGEGYSAAFVHHAYEMLVFLEKCSSNRNVMIVGGCDELCQYCPNNHNETCSDEDEVREYDDNYLNILKLSTGQVLSWIEIKQNIANKLFISDFSKICGKCHWYSICREVLHLK